MRPSLFHLGGVRCVSLIDVPRDTLVVQMSFGFSLASSTILWTCHNIGILIRLPLPTRTWCCRLVSQVLSSSVSGPRILPMPLLVSRCRQQEVVLETSILLLRWPLGPTYPWCVPCHRHWRLAIGCGLGLCSSHDHLLAHEAFGWCPFICFDCPLTSVKNHSSIWCGDVLCETIRQQLLALLSLDGAMSSFLSNCGSTK